MPSPLSVALAVFDFGFAVIRRLPAAAVAAFFIWMAADIAGQVVGWW